MNGTVLVCLDRSQGSPTAERACAAVVDGVVDAGGRLRDPGVVAAWSLLERAGDADVAMVKASALLREVGSDLVT